MNPRMKVKSLTIRIVFDPEAMKEEIDLLEGTEDMSVSEQVDTIIEAMNEAPGISVHLLTYEGD